MLEIGPIGLCACGNEVHCEDYFEVVGCLQCPLHGLGDCEKDGLIIYTCPKCKSMSEDARKDATCCPSSLSLQ